MNFVVKQRKPPVVPIVSLIDILAILLIFFIATSTFKKPKLGVDIEPPSPGTLATRPVDEARTTLSISADNEIFFGSDSESLGPVALAGKLLAAHASGEKLELKADEQAGFGTVVKALDALKKAGYKEGDYPTILKVQQPDPETSPESLPIRAAPGTNPKTP